MRDAAWTRCWPTVRELMLEERKKKKRTKRVACFLARARLPVLKKIGKNGSNSRRQLLTPGGIGIGDAVGFQCAVNEHVQFAREPA
jgi:hypothetical protein